MDGEAFIVGILVVALGVILGFVGYGYVKGMMGQTAGASY